MNTSGHGTGLFSGSKKHLLLALAGGLCLTGGMLRAEPASTPAPEAGISPAVPTTREQGKALLKAAEAGRLADVQKLLEQGVPVDFLNTTNGWSALMFAAKGGHAEVAHLLMEKGADVNRRSTTDIGSIVLNFATEGKNLELMEDLLKHGARINGKGRSGMTAFAYAANHGLLAQAKFLLSKGADINLLAERDNHDESLSPLMWAINGERQEMVVWLLDQGADLEKATANGTTALGISAKRKAPAITKLLLDRGAKVDVRGLGDHTALMCACNNGNLETVKMLLEAGANPFLVCEEEGKDALGHANYSKNEDLIQAVEEARKRWKQTKDRI